VPTQTYLDPADDEDIEEVLNDFLGTGDSAANKLGDAILSFWEKRVQKLQHDYAIAGWILSVDSRVRDYVKNRVGTEHRAAMERVVCKLHTAPCPNQSKWLKGKSMDEIVDKFWEEEMLFRKMEGPFNPRRFN
jgi:hypothetical protein